MRVTRSPARAMGGETYESEAARASLRLVVLETVVWASSRADAQDPIRCLRSAALAPVLFDASRHETVFHVIAERHRALEAAHQLIPLPGRSDDLVDTAAIGLPDLHTPLVGGRLLAWERDAAIDDGVGQAKTKGYLDHSDMPPWDTWIAYVEQPRASTRGESPYRVSRRDTVSCLVSWVPQLFVAAVDRAVKANGYEALYWLRDSKLPISEVLRAEGLLA